MTGRGRKAVLAGALAAVVLSGAAGSARPRTDSSATGPAAVPSAQAVPKTVAARKAANVVVFAAFGDIPSGGFNAALTCCNSLASQWLGFREALHGAYIRDDRGEWVEDLVTDASATKTHLTYTISPKAFWYWGGRKLPVTYRDFVYTLQQIDDPNNDIYSRTGYANLDPARFEHKGDRQVTFFWRTSRCSTDFPCRPYANWPSLFGNLYPAAALAGLDFNTIWRSCICGSDGKPVADGPFYLADYTRGQGSVLKANPYWGGTKPRIAQIVFKVIADPNFQAEALRSGAVDAFTSRFDRSLLPLKNTPGITFEQVPGYFMEQLWFREGNAKGSPSVHMGSSNVLLQAPWMRQAIGLAIDRQAIIDAEFGRGSGPKPLDSLLFYATESGYRPDFARWNHNPGKALALLKAHCTGGPSRPNPDNDKVWQCSGLPATFRWQWSIGNEPRERLEALAKADLKSIGIAITDRPLPSNVNLGPNGLVPSGDFDIFNSGWFTSGDPGDFYDFYRCFGDNNHTGYCSHTVDALLQAANRELHPARRRALFRRADAILAARVPAMPLFQWPFVLIHKSDLLGMRLNPDTDGPGWNAEDWHWKR
jgi:peptide/nickel transport system substrate-binding protein